MDYQMSEDSNLKRLIFTRTWHIPIAKKELFNIIVNELYKLFPPMNFTEWWFYQSAWEQTDSGNYMDFYLNPEYFYIRHKIDSTTPIKEYERLKAEFEKNSKKIIKKVSLFINNDYPYKLHIDLLETDESGCIIEIECHPFLYYNIVNSNTEVDKLEKERAILAFKRHLKTLAVGLKAKEIDKTESDLSKFTAFLGLDRKWMTATYALQLQEVSITLVAKEKNIVLDKKNVSRILRKDIKEKNGFFSYKYEAFVKEVKRLYDVEIPFMAMWLRKMRQAVLHEGHNPTETEKKHAISATVCLLKELKKVYEAETIVEKDSSP